MKKWMILVVAAAVFGYGILGYHYIITDNGLKVLKKSGFSIEYTFVDARGVKAHRLLTNPALVKAGIKDAIK